MKRLTLATIFFLTFSTAIVAHAGEFDGLWLLQEFPTTLFTIRHDTQTILLVEMDMRGTRTWHAYFGTISGSEANLHSLLSDVDINANISFTSLNTALMVVVSCFSPDPTSCQPAGTTIHLNKLY